MKVPAGTQVFVGLAIGAVVVAVVGGLIVLGPPSEERARRLDERRVEDLRGITRAADLYWTRRGRLPSSLEDLSRESGVSVSARDPGTTQDYEFRVLDAETYELCARFDRNTPDPGDSAPAPIGFEGVLERQPPDGRALGIAADPAQDVSEDFWSHGVGRRCFRLDAQEVPARERRQR